MKSWLRCCMALLMAFGPLIVVAHEVRPAYLEVIETAANRATVVWKQPTGIQTPSSLAPSLSPHLLDRAPDEVQGTDGFEVQRWRNIELDGAGISGREVSIDGLQRTITDALLVVRFRNGEEVQQVLTPAHPTFVINDRQGAAIPAYLWLGIDHILTGFDHLLFVLGLMLLSPTLKRLIGTITAFTFAHSLTLAATALHWLRVNPPLIEVLVALSILCLAVELIRRHRGDSGLTSRYPWMIAFMFGLLHGSAFAGALQDIGLPEHNLLPAIFLFNVGVELGQIAFVAVMRGLLHSLARIEWRNPAWVSSVWATVASAYIIGSLSMFWLLERLQVALANIR